MKLSRGFVCMLIGFAMTVGSWFSPWKWPAAPAFLVLNKFFGGSYADFEKTKRALVLLLLIAVNTFWWALVAYILISVIRAVMKKKDEVPSE